MEKYQVICFEGKVIYPLGGAGKWFDFDAKRSTDQVTKALAAVKPEGGTNMYAALKAAFAYRPQGLDTIYLLSDGLPNQGEGLSAWQRQNLRGVERGAALARHIHKVLKTDWNKPTPGKPKVRIHTIGFFYESPDLGAFLWALARSNEGSFVGMSKP